MTALFDIWLDDRDALLGKFWVDIDTNNKKKTQKNIERKTNNIADADVFWFLFVLSCAVSYSVFVLGKQMYYQYKKNN